ncbi:MAG: endonuclease/exonuclease/phosphatase family protein [Bacteroidales bacterium]|nr:endonuclease/exonuclease/phosphatase family protein [Bacteroidales bacterium]
MAYYKKIKYMQGEMKERTLRRLLDLREQLHNELPERTANETLLLATWNIREFGEGRLEESYYYIAEIIDHFDLVVVQEVNSTQMGGLEKVMSILGSNWSYIVSDGVAGTSGGAEAMAFIYNTNKVKFTNLAGEIVLPENKTIDGMQFARTPFMASFRAGWFDFKLCTVHIYYGSKKNELGQYERRLKEIKAISRFLLDRQKKEDISYIILGDFNIPKTDSEYFNALSSKTGFYVPEEIKATPTDLGNVNHYDQIGFKLKLDDDMAVWAKGKQKAGAFNFSKSVFKHSEEESDYLIYRQYYEKEGMDDAALKKAFKQWRTFEISDHLPLWVELHVNFSDQYLRKNL